VKRILAGNEDDFPIASPNSFDQACFMEMSDEFWLQAGTVIIYFKFVLFRQFIYIVYWILGLITREYRRQNASNDR
jgi:hypothetical protein